MRKIYRFLLKLKYWQYVLLFFAAIMAVNIVLSNLPFVDVSGIYKLFDKMHVALVFVVAVVVAPIFETVMFQTLPLKYGYRLLKNKLGFRRCAWPLMVASAVVFAAQHTYSMGYVMAMIVIGMGFAFAYHVGRKRRQSPTVAVMLIHACMNLAGIAGYIAERITG